MESNDNNASQDIIIDLPYQDKEKSNLEMDNDIIVDMSEMDKDSSNGINQIAQDNRLAQYEKNIVIITQEDLKENKNELKVINHPENKTKNLIQIVSNKNEIILFFFINPLAGSGSGINVINMEVKKVEFSDNLGCTGNPRCTAYIYDLNNQSHLQTGIEHLRNELSRGKFYLFKYIKYP